MQRYKGAFQFQKSLMHNKAAQKETSILTFRTCFAAYPVSHCCFTANPDLVDLLSYAVSCLPRIMHPISFPLKRPIPSSRHTYFAQTSMEGRYMEMGTDKQFSFHKPFSDVIRGVILIKFCQRQASEPQFLLLIQFWVLASITISFLRPC